MYLLNLVQQKLSLFVARTRKWSRRPYVVNGYLPKLWKRSMRRDTGMANRILLSTLVVMKMKNTS